MLRSHTCGELRLDDVARHVTLAGWVNRRRDHGGLVFLNLRDRYGLTQIVFDPDEQPEAMAAAREVGGEWVVSVSGVVRPRPEGQANPDMPTGDIEVLAHQLAVLNPSRTPPFEVARELDVEEGLRLRYRYLDLRRTRMQRNMLLRHEVTAFARHALNERGFLEIETPILIKSTPEGARDFLVPSRMHRGKFYALPQSPQQIKQLLMVSGMDRYYQVARCFRDEDLRADRQLEFTQLDIEMAFVDEDDVMALNEEILIDLVSTVTPHYSIVETPFPRLSYEEALARFGTDQPDMRFGLELIDISEVVAHCDFRVFSSTVEAGGQVKALAAPATLSRREIGVYEELVREHGAAGLAWLSYADNGTRGSIARFLSDDESAAIRRRTGAQSGTTLLIVAGEPAIVARALGRLREEVARHLELIPDGTLAFAWIVDPPLFEWNADEGRWDSAHNPFTSPQARDLPLLATSPGRVRARAYDVVCNGFELAGGAIRIHERALQARVFDLLGLADDTMQAQFGHLLDAFEYGAPPHGGIAWGFDRVVMVLAGENSIREVIAFPKTLSGVDPMTASPAAPPPGGLEELGIALRDPTRPTPPAAEPEGSTGEAPSEKEPR